MGREIKRVPLNFKWPLEKKWHGFINPYREAQVACPHCEGGHSKEYTALQSRWYSHLGGGFKPEHRGSVPYLPSDPLVREIITRKIERCDEAGRNYYGYGEPAIEREAVRMCEIWNSSWSHHLNQQDVDALVKGGRLMDLTHTWEKDKGWQKKKGPLNITPKQVNDWSLQGMAHDSINCWIVIKEELKRLGQPAECKHCKGNGIFWSDKRSKWHYDHWKYFEPPTGPAYQLWETVSEGSPISPVFGTPEELADWMAAPGHGWECDRGTTREQWLRFINGPGWAPSFISSPQTGLVSGVQAAT